MAEGLLWERLAGSVSDGTTKSDSDSKFSHDLDDPAHIREISMDISMGGAAPDENLEVELTESPATIGGTDLSPFFIRSLRVEMPATGASPVDGGISVRKTWKFARGQVMIRPNKELYVNVNKTTGGSGSYRIDIGYEED